MPANARALTGRPVGTVTRWGRARALTGLVLALIAVPRLATAQLVVDRLELTFRERQSAQTPQLFAISNSGSTPIQVTISLADWDRAETGENRFFDAGT
ncbi:MAG: hypothetical protein RL139_1225, partial [Gemmatimonadota bacterium]